MDPDTLIITVFRRTDDAVKHILAGQRLRQRGPKPALSHVRQAANLCRVEELACQHILKAVPHDPNQTIQDSKGCRQFQEICLKASVLVIPVASESGIRHPKIRLCCQRGLDSRFRGNDGEYNDTP